MVFFLCLKQGVNVLANTNLHFTDNSSACKAAIKHASVQWLMAMGQLSESAIRPLIPVLSAHLKTSLSHVVDENKLECTVGVNAKYAVYVEFGTGVYAESGGRKTPWAYKSAFMYSKTGQLWHITRGQKPKPFMRNGYRQIKPKGQILFQQYLGEFIP